MKCEECRNGISEYMDGEFPREDSSDMKSHLEECADCRRKYEMMRKIAAATDDLPQHRPGTEVVLKISRAIHQNVARPSRTEFGPVLDISELAEFLRVDAATIDEYLDQIPCFELGGKLLFRKKSIEAWIEEREKSFSYQAKRFFDENAFIRRNINLGGSEWKPQKSN